MTVYFIGNRQAGLVKIGHTKRLIKSRVSEYVAGFPYRPELLGYAKGVHGVKEYERSLHRAFKDLQTDVEGVKPSTEREWFMIGDDLVELILWHMCDSSRMSKRLIKRLKDARVPDEYLHRSGIALPEKEVKKVGKLLAKALFRLFPDTHLSPVDQENILENISPSINPRWGLFEVAEDTDCAECGRIESECECTDQ